MIFFTRKAFERAVDVAADRRLAERFERHIENELALSLAASAYWGGLPNDKIGPASRKLVARAIRAFADAIKPRSPDVDAKPPRWGIGHFSFKDDAAIDAYMAWPPYVVL